MPLALLALALATMLAAPALAAEACPAVERAAGPPVYAILHGYRHGPPGHAAPVDMVNHDLGEMARFLGALGPRQMHAHAEPTGAMRSRLGDAFRPATWRALLGSVDAVIEDIDRAGGDARPRVYVYFAGHGTLGDRDRLDLFTAPEAGADAPGYDGTLDSKLVADHITRPLARRAEVHLIVDACHSYHLMQTRSVHARDKLSPGPPLDMAYGYDFAAEHPGVGAMMAARELTREDANYGGLFSHLVRSLAIGVADLDRDGVVTYGEMAHALPQTAASDAHVPDPVVIPPALDFDRAFIDWRSTPAAQVCFPGDIRGKRLLLGRYGIFATVHLPDVARALWLPSGQTFGLDTWGAGARYFRAEDGPLRFTAPPTRTPEALRTAMDPEPTPAAPAAATEASPDLDPEVWEPFPGILRDDIRPPGAEADPAIPLGPRYSAGLAALLGASLVDAGRDGAHFAPRLDLAGRLGVGGHRLLLDARVALPGSVHVDDGPAAPAAVYGPQLGGRAGYGRALVGGDLEIALDLLVGLHRLWNPDGPGPRRFDVAEATARATLVWPLGDRSRWGIRLDVEVGAGYSGGVFGPIASLAAGVDYEALLR